MAMLDKKIWHTVQMGTRFTNNYISTSTVTMTPSVLWGVTSLLQRRRKQCALLNCRKFLPDYTVSFHRRLWYSQSLPSEHHISIRIGWNSIPGRCTGFSMPQSVRPAFGADPESSPIFKGVFCPESKAAGVSCRSLTGVYGGALPPCQRHVNGVVLNKHADNLSLFYGAA